MGYASPTDMIKRFDVRTLGDLVDDSGDRQTATELETDAKLIAALDSAAGLINAACLQGERYTVSDLAGLAGDSAEYLIDMNCTIAMASLWRRRHYTEENETRRESIARADEELRRLRSGEWVFDVSDQKVAGRADVTTVSRVAVGRDWELVADKARGHVYPRRRSYRDI